MEDDHEISAFLCYNFAGKQVITTKKVPTLERAQSFKTSNPSFIVAMRASYVEHRFRLVSCKETFGF